MTPAPVTLELPPASAGWHEGDPPGQRLFADLGAMTLESGATLPAVRVAYEVHGEPVRDDEGRVVNAVLVEHALTADSHVSGPAGPGHGSAGWWSDFVGPGRPLDTSRWLVVCANVLGGCQGTTGPSSLAPDGLAWGSRWPAVSVRDQVVVEQRLADVLGIDSFALVVGASMGGMRALEWAVSTPARVRRLALIAAPSESGADAIASTSVQLHAIRDDPAWNGGDYHDAKDGEGPHLGLALARRIAHLTYRTRAELEARFGRDPQTSDATGRFAVESYLDHHGEKLVRRFDAGSYVCLAAAMNGHSVGRGRGGVEAALARVTAETVVVAIDSDRLYPPCEQERIAAGVPGASLVVVESLYGHDGFLLEVGQIAAALAPLLEV